jgi:GxxExxY protein
MGARTNTNTARTNTNLLHGELVYRIVACFLRVYDRLGFGFLESVYRNALAWEFERAGISFEREVAIDVWDMGRKVGHFRADFLVESVVIVEVKATKEVDETDTKQILNYLRGSKPEVGLLLHFGPKAYHRRFLYTNDRKPHLN